MASRATGSSSGSALSSQPSSRIERTARRRNPFQQLVHTVRDKRDDAFRAANADRRRRPLCDNDSSHVGERNAQIGPSYIDACDIARIFYCRNVALRGNDAASGLLFRR